MLTITLYHKIKKGIKYFWKKLVFPKVQKEGGGGGRFIYELYTVTFGFLIFIF